MKKTVTLKDVSMKYILSHLYIWHDPIKMGLTSDVMRMCFVQLVVKYKCQTRQSLMRDNTWLFQVCKHLISCILQCAIRDHLGHVLQTDAISI